MKWTRWLQVLSLLVALVTIITWAWKRQEQLREIVTRLARFSVGSDAFGRVRTVGHSLLSLVNQVARLRQVIQ